MFKTRIETFTVEGTTFFTKDAVPFLVIENLPFEEPFLYNGEDAIHAVDNFGLTFAELENLEVLAEDGDIKIRFMEL